MPPPFSPSSKHKTELNLKNDLDSQRGLGSKVTKQYLWAQQQRICINESGWAWFGRPNKSRILLNPPGTTSIFLLASAPGRHKDLSEDWISGLVQTPLVSWPSKPHEYFWSLSWKFEYSYFFSSSFWKLFCFIFFTHHILSISLTNSSSIS